MADRLRGLALILVLAGSAGAATAPGPRGLTSGWCGLTAYRDPIANLTADGRFAVPATITPTATGVRFEGSCGVFDFFKFGPGFAQLFSGQSFGFGMGWAEPGVVRAYGEATAIIDPTQYNVGVIGTNPYRARVLWTTASYFADVFVPPPASGAPNAGNPTTLTATFNLDCIESGTFGVNSTIFVGAYTPESYAADDVPYDSIMHETDVVPGVLHAPCPIGPPVVPPKVFNVTVGTPVVVLLAIGVSLHTGTTTLQAPSLTVFSNALNTATLILTNADGAPLTGQSGKVYSDPGTLPTVTTSTTVTTTSSEPPTTTTLAGCAGTCGDGAVDAACGEACDCAATADPIQAAYGCDGEAIQPTQAGCMTCRGCRLVALRCELPTTTTVPGATTSTIPGATTTTVAGGSTTTTTVPGPCTGLAGPEAARCEIDAFLAQPLCPDAPAPKKIETGLRRQLGAAAKALGRALTASAKKRTRLLNGATKKLAGVGRRAGKLGGKKLSAPCAARIDGLVDRATQLIEGS